MNIYVGNLNFRVKEPQLQEAFEAFGEVTLVKIVRNKETLIVRLLLLLYMMS